MTGPDDSPDADVVDLVGPLGRLLANHPGGIVVGDPTTGEVVRTVPPDDYDVDVAAALDELADAPLVVRYKVAGVGVVAEVHRTTRGMLWTSTFEVVDTRTIPPAARRYVERIVRDRRRHDRADPTTGMMRSLRAVVELIDHPGCTAERLEYGTAANRPASIPLERAVADSRAAGTARVRTVTLN